MDKSTNNLPATGCRDRKSLHTADTERLMAAMRAAVRSGDVDAASRALDEAASLLCGPEADDARLCEVLSSLDKDGVALPHIAAERGDLDMLKLLHGRGCIPVNVKDARGGEPVLEAAAAGRLACIKWLVEEQNVDVNTADDRGDTVLHLASGFGHLDVMRWLLDHGAQVDPRTKINVTPLLYATAKGRIEAVRLLLHSGASIEAHDAERGWNAAHTAAGCNQATMLKFLINSYPGLFASKTTDGLSLAEVARGEKCPDTFLAIVHFSKESEREARRQQAESARKKQAEEERLAKELAQRDFERLERDLQTLRSAKKKSSAAGNSPAKATLQTAGEASTTGGPKAKKGAKKRAKAKKTTQSRLQRVPETAPATAHSAAENADDSDDQTESKPQEDDADPVSKAQEDDADPAGSTVFVASAQTLGVVGRPTRSSRAEDVDADEEERAFASGETWQVKLSKRERKLLKKLRDHRSERSESEDSLSLSTSESGSDDCSLSANQAREGSAREQQSQAKRAAAGSQDPAVAETCENRPRSSPNQQQPPQQQPLTPRRGPGVPLSPVKRKNSCESRWTLGHALKISTEESAEEAPTSDVETAGAAPSTETAIPGGSCAGIAQTAAAATSSGNASSSASSPGSDACSETSMREGSDGKKAESRLRPHAPPWSPRRRRWTSPAANAGQVKAKLLVDEPPEVVENEFQRMLKRFVHMDTGARRTAKRKFAKATAEYEEKRLADAEQMETAWRNSIRSRLEKGIPLLQFRSLSLALAEIDAAEEARRMDNEIQHTILSEDQELANLVKRTKATLARKDEVPLAAYAQDWRSGKLLRIPPDVFTETSKFAVALRHSVEAWRMRDSVLRVWIRFGGDELARAAKAREIGFDFDHARPGMLLMSCCVASSSSSPTLASAAATQTQAKSIPLVLVAAPLKKAARTSSVPAKRVLLVVEEGAKDEADGYELPAQGLHTGENPLHAAEVLAQELSGMAFSLTAQSLPGTKEEVFVGTIHLDVETEKAIADTSMAGAKWFAFADAKKRLASAAEQRILAQIVQHLPSTKQ